MNRHLARSFIVHVVSPDDADTLCSATSAPQRLLIRCIMLPQIFKHKPKKHYQRKTGHRQPLTKFLVTKITPVTAEA